MTPAVFTLLSLAGGVGATARFRVDGWVRASMRTDLQVATALVNLTGSLALGFLTGLIDADLVSSNVGFVVGTGFLGGYTTFSTASYETVSLVRSRRYGQALMSGVGLLVGCVLLAALGLWLGSNL